MKQKWDFDAWGTALIRRWHKQWRVAKIAKDIANPERVARRQQRAFIWGKIKMYAFFIFALFILPIGGTLLGIQQKFAGNEAWPIIIASSLSGGASVWVIIIAAWVKYDKEEKSKTTASENNQ